MFKNARTKGLVYATFAGLAWGLTGPLGQYLFESKSVIAEWLVPYRMVASGIVILVYLFIRRGTSVFEILSNKKDALGIIIYGIAGMMTVQYSFFSAVEASNGGTATVLQYTNPAMMVLFFVLARKQIPSKQEITAVILTLIGVFLLSTNGNIHSLVITPKGLILGLLCAVFTCLYSMLPEGLLKKYSADLVCGWAMLIGGLFLTLWKRPWTMGVCVDTEVTALMVFLVIFGTVFPFVASLTSIPLIGPVVTNILSSVEPVVASIITFFVLGTRFGKGEILGFAIIIFTIIILSAEPGENKKQ